MASEAFDYIIVAAGAGGCVLANRLSADKDVKVLLLEAGGRDNSLYMHMPLGWRQIWRGPAHNWNFYSEPEPYADGRKFLAPRGKTLGGSTSINGMLYVRGHPRDYDEWRPARGRGLELRRRPALLQEGRGLLGRGGPSTTAARAPPASPGSTRAACTTTPSWPPPAPPATWSPTTSTARSPRASPRWTSR
ncbi:MAG: GMC family oxidoreductase N-terminal domain-containing protein [Caulobacteraceae bacterium]